MDCWDFLMVKGADNISELNSNRRTYMIGEYQFEQAVLRLLSLWMLWQACTPLPINTCFSTC